MGGRGARSGCACSRPRRRASTPRAAWPPARRPPSDAAPRSTRRARARHRLGGFCEARRLGAAQRRREGRGGERPPRDGAGRDAQPHCSNRNGTGTCGTPAARAAARVPAPAWCTTTEQSGKRAACATDSHTNTCCEMSVSSSDAHAVALDAASVQPESSTAQHFDFAHAAATRRRSCAVPPAKGMDPKPTLMSRLRCFAGSASSAAAHAASHSASFGGREGAASALLWDGQQEPAQNGGRGRVRWQLSPRQAQPRVAVQLRDGRLLFRVADKVTARRKVVGQGGQPEAGPERNPEEREARTHNKQSDA